MSSSPCIEDCSRVSCAACSKNVAFENAYFCERCLEVGTCSPECWGEISKSHSGMCDSPVGEELGICADCDCDGKACCDTASPLPSVDAPHHHGGGGTKVTFHGSGGGRPGVHTSRHPTISRSKLQTMLHHGSVRGHPLTQRQRGLFYHMLGTKR